MPKRYRIADFNEIEPVACPCGQARRAFAADPTFPGTLHRTTITGRAKPHYHEHLTETYYVLECAGDAQLRLDDDYIALRSGMSIVIPPGVVHQAIGDMTVLIIVIPKFDPSDEIVLHEDS